MRPIVAISACLLWMLGCASAPPATRPPPSVFSASPRPAHDAPAAPPTAADPFAELSAAVLRSRCTDPVPMPPVPSRPPAGDAATDVAFYTAHPDDEAMYGGGTMARLARAGRRLALVVLSHGEGGRLWMPSPTGALIERRDRPRHEVVAVRDQEIARASRRVPVPYTHLFAATDNLDYAFTTSCEEALGRWHRQVGGGVAGMLRRLVEDLRRRRPRVVVTLDPRDDPEASHHGHHRATGTLVEVAARVAADPRFSGGPTHVVEELFTYAPHGVRPDLALEVGSAARLAMLREYRSQFRPRDLETPLARRRVERFVLRWRARNSAPAEKGFLLARLAAGLAGAASP